MRAIKLTPRTALSLLLACSVLPALSACGGSASSATTPPVKANGCTALATGTSGGRQVVSYDDITSDPSMSSAITAAAAEWNASAVPILLKPSTTGGTVTIATSTYKTFTSPCLTRKARASIINIDTNAWHGTAGVTKVKNPVRDMALEFGHALGLSDAGSCNALMTASTCSTYAKGPNAAEVAEIDRLYGAAH